MPLSALKRAVDLAGAVVGILSMNRRIQLALKRAFDIVVSLTVLTLPSPLTALIALTIHLTKHPMSGMPTRIRRKKRKERVL